MTFPPVGGSWINEKFNGNGNTKFMCTLASAGVATIAALLGVKGEVAVRIIKTGLITLGANYVIGEMATIYFKGYRSTHSKCPIGYRNRNVYYYDPGHHYSAYETGYTYGYYQNPY